MLKKRGEPTSASFSLAAKLVPLRGHKWRTYDIRI